MWLINPSWSCASNTPSTIQSLESFKQIPVLDGGRILPLDSYARFKLLQFSGRQSFDRQPAVKWLARLLFTPNEAVRDKVFLINHPEVPQALGIPVDAHRRYSFFELKDALDKFRELALAATQVEEKKRTLVEAELVRVYGNLDLFMGLFHTFQFVVPQEVFALSPEASNVLGLPPHTTSHSFLDVFTNIEQIRNVIEPLEKKEQSSWTKLESSIFNVSSQMFEWMQRIRNLPFEVIPVQAHGEQIWLSPWDAIALLHQDASVKEMINQSARLAKAYVTGEQLEFDLAATSIRRAVEEQLPGHRELSVHRLEILYNKYTFFLYSKLFYGLAFLLAFASMLSAKAFPRRAGLICCLFAWAPHSIGILIRMIIMGRPPVTNLYATFIFVAWVSVLICLLVEYAQRSGVGLIGASFSGLSLLMISGRFASEGDPMGKVVAVLNSNFWLSTHVVCITTGYAGCCVAGIIGHVYILQSLFLRTDSPKLSSTRNALIAMLGFGLTFSFFGTMLGGVWADQSWGRFWGWDPKENGALLIVLWCAILFHSRLAGLVKDLGFAVGSVLGIIVVMFAWLGVNLLGVGLHSYGFTSGLAKGLILYIVIQLLFLLVTIPLIKSKNAASAMRVNLS